VIPVNVLLTAASRRVPLVLAFRNALRSLGLPGQVIATDVNPLSPAVHVADRAYRVPLSTDPAYLPELLAICEAENVRLAVPTIDDELALFAEAGERFRGVGTLPVCSPVETARACDDKFETCRVLRSAGVSAAVSYLAAGLPADVPMPLFIKPRVGRGAVGAFQVRNRRELEFFLDYVSNPVLQELLDGPEYTIDVLCDFDGRPLSVVPRERVVIRAGVIDRGRTVKSQALIDLALATCRAMRFAGPINIQCRMRGDVPVIIEINPRFSGGIPLTIAAGADFPRMLLRLALGLDVPPAIGEFEDGLWMTSYESGIFLEPQRIRLPSLAETAGCRIGEVA
jgi:carbamoyl-phosphate synthase large subunit